MTKDEINSEISRISKVDWAIRLIPPVGFLVINGVEFFSSIVALVILYVSKRILADPYRTRKSGQLSKRMLGSISEGVHVARGISWFDPVPGALVITGDDKIGLINRTTDLEPVFLSPDQIMKASVEVETTTTAETKNGGSAVIGGVSTSGLGAGWNFGSTSKTTFHHHHDYTVEIMWQQERNSKPLCAVIPMSNRQLAEGLAFSLNKMSEQAPLAYARSPQLLDEHQAPINSIAQAG